MHTQGWAAACNDFPLLTPCWVETSAPAVGGKVYPDARAHWCAGRSQFSISLWCILCSFILMPFTTAAFWNHWHKACRLQTGTLSLCMCSAHLFSSHCLLATSAVSGPWGSLVSSLGMTYPPLFYPPPPLLVDLYSAFGMWPHLLHEYSLCTISIQGYSNLSLQSACFFRTPSHSISDYYSF